MHRLTKDFLASFFWAITATVLLMQCNNADAFPQNTRLGYINCGSCHISPSGGGALTAYGKSTAGELSTWFVGSEDFQESALISGGDLRYLWYKAETPNTKIEDRFLMQADLELGVRAGVLTLVGQYGTYHGYPQDFEASYKHYAMFKLGNLLSLRAGKFRPTLGINHDDHTLPVQSLPGFRHRDSSNNFEVRIGAKTWNLTGTAIVGCQGGYVDADRKDYCDNDAEGYALYSAWMPDPIFHSSMSMGHLSKADGSSIDRTIVSVTTGTKYVYMMGEFCRSVDVDARGSVKKHDTGWADIVLSYKGFDVGPTLRHYEFYVEKGAKVRWLPVNGLELTAAYLAQDEQKKIVAVTHLYF